MAHTIRVLVTALLLTGSVMAQSASTTESDRLILAAQQQISLDQAIAQVRKQTGGRILSANTSSKGGGKTHNIKVLMPNGVVRVIRVNAGGR